jgi:hypothetical protein
LVPSINLTPSMLATRETDGLRLGVLRCIQCAEICPLPLCVISRLPQLSRVRPLRTAYAASAALAVRAVGFFFATENSTLFECGEFVQTNYTVQGIGRQGGLSETPCGVSPIKSSSEALE